MGTVTKDQMTMYFDKSNILAAAAGRGEAMECGSHKIGRNFTIVIAPVENVHWRPRPATVPNILPASQPREFSYYSQVTDFILS